MNLKKPVILLLDDGLLILSISPAGESASYFLDVRNCDIIRIKTTNNSKQSMKKALEEHISFIENILRKKKNNFDWKALSDYNRTRIGFFQHERLIHLLITLFFGLMFFGSVIAALLLTNASNDSLFLNFGLLAISAISLLMIFFYVWHYFFLENGVQKLYRLENQIAKNCQENNFLK